MQALEDDGGAGLELAKDSCGIRHTGDALRAGTSGSGVGGEGQSPAVLDQAEGWGAGRGRGDDVVDVREREQVVESRWVTRAQVQRFDAPVPFGERFGIADAAFQGSQRIRRRMWSGQPYWSCESESSLSLLSLSLLSLSLSESTSSES
jgi:hypothetical protein